MLQSPSLKQRTFIQTLHNKAFLQNGEPDMEKVRVLLYGVGAVG
ncbi:hypothetical protein KEJ15_06740, partial [Candidatus Bathyarchaeota archaeon]|nr:hypothetical protein [Candidatus Bathyarchaeota archaeon]